MDSLAHEDHKWDIPQLFQELFLETNDILWFLDGCSGKLYLSRQFYVMNGYTQEQEQTIRLIEDFYPLIHPADRKQVAESVEKLVQRLTPKLAVEFRMINRLGKMRHILIKGHLTERIMDGDATSGSLFASGTLTEISELKQKASQLNRLTYFDSLTQMPNRSMFTYRTTVAVQQRLADSGTCAVVYMDLDNFQRINDLYGQYFGDDVLQAAGRTMTEFLGPELLVARPSGDEFLILFSEIEGKKALAERIEHLRQLMARPMMVQGREIQLACSTGVAIYPEDGHNAEELIKNADAALHQAKKEGKNRNAFYEVAIKTALIKRTQMERELHEALSRNELRLLYQPQLDLHSGQIIGVEALLRWDSPTHGQVSPLEFIPLAEDSGLIIPIGLWVLQQACQQIEVWRRQGLGHLTIAVNLSPVQLSHEGFYATVMQQVKGIEFVATSLCLEITESILVDDLSRVSAILSKFRSKGVKIALDDFGTGYSSLNYLKDLPLDVLKIDKTFIDNFEQGDTEKEITRTIVSLAHILRLDVVAEGVETLDQFGYLREIGCNKVQGYYVSRPIPADEIGPFLQALEMT
ncbi:GGDEF domain-containing phosphodiesterase [Desulfosporosinus sp. Sb-LF]|uniref:putative bifunctional diguanylate cyclase/phosphodiesterase n=1 Tax=Desulfosporosinus sp. Sb-LF TaxID=2560027 RepID=UPI00107EFCCB|nr:GGDEF domain-containing phosphodiesterase [Desulfosporosinus sp. Sb-LF]TGE32931.1 EAL domain-containing protein [Desulfosporosinus sp. Sb-LF]